MKKIQGVWALVLAVGVLFSLPARAVLIDRGNGLIYDIVLDITWLQDASFGGFRTWDDAAAWADSLVFEGFDDWRLPSISVSSGLPTGSTASLVNCATATEVNCRDNEFGYMYYWNLTPAGDTPPTDAGTDLTGDQGLIQNIQSVHWSGTEFAPNPVLGAWFFVFDNGAQAGGDKNDDFAAWAVRPGDVLAAPEPATGLLLAGLGWSRRRRRPRRG